MDNEKLKTYLILKYGSLDAMIGEWMANKIKPTIEEKSILKDHLITVFPGRMAEVKKFIADTIDISDIPDEETYNFDSLSDDFDINDFWDIIGFPYLRD